MKLLSLFLLMTSALSQCLLNEMCLSPCQSALNETLPSASPFVRASIINKSCEIWPTTNDARRRLAFCKRLVLGSAFYDVGLDLRKLPAGVCGLQSRILYNSEDQVLIRVQ